jgi:hypothetical protein
MLARHSSVLLTFEHINYSKLKQLYCTCICRCKKFQFFTGLWACFSLLSEIWNLYCYRLTNQIKDYLKINQIPVFIKLYRCIWLCSVINCIHGSFPSCPTENQHTQKKKILHLTGTWTRSWTTNYSSSWPWAATREKNKARREKWSSCMHAEIDGALLVVHAESHKERNYWFDSVLLK